MWALKHRLSPQQRTVSEFDQLVPDNLEFTISLLDCRYLAGDRELFTRLHESDRKSTRLNSSHGYISYAVFCLKKKIHAVRRHWILLYSLGAAIAHAAHLHTIPYLIVL